MALPLLAAVIAAACGDDSPKPTPSERPVSTATATPGPAYAANPAYRIPLGDLNALVAASNAIAVIEFQ